MRQAKSILLDSDRLMSAGRALLSVIESRWPVEFTDTAGESIAGLVIDTPSPRRLSCPYTLEIAQTRANPQAGAVRQTDICFADDPAVPWPYRGRRVSTRLDMSAAPLAVRADEKVLACDGTGKAVWTVACPGAGRAYRTCLALPAIDAGQPVATVAGVDRFIQVLPLFEFAREVSGALGYQLPPLRASFMVDDPNLHWPTYGYADFRTIAQQAQRNNYHVAFGTIPLDAWYSHGGAAAVFRQHPQQLSLLIHGNDHGRDELARVESSAACAELLRHAIARIETLERKSGLTVSRVMVPPHGACSATMLEQLPANHFEAACISTGSLLAHNPDRAWTRSIGFAPAELLEGCPVLPRWSLTTVTQDMQLAAAYLGQALILRAHHQDLKDGLGVFDDAARFINSLGPVHWADLGRLARLNFRWRRDGSICRVQPIGTTIRLTVPPYATELVVDDPDHAWAVAGAGRSEVTVTPGVPVSIGAWAGQSVDIRRVVDTPAQVGAMPLRRTNSRLILRRLLTEARDRLLV